MLKPSLYIINNGNIYVGQKFQSPVKFMSLENLYLYDIVYIYGNCQQSQLLILTIPIV